MLAAAFRRAGLESPDLDARVLLCAACGLDHAGLARDPASPLGTAATVLADYAARRLRREPVSRILGRREFWGLSLAIGPQVLDPRPDTEGLVGALLDGAGGRREAPLAILDLGTGSGAILCALLSELRGAYGVGVDRSAAACRIARDNLRASGLGDRSSVVCGDWDAPLGKRFDLVACNPPYIPTPDIEGLAPEVRRHDPHLALDGGADGLGPYRLLIPHFPGRLTVGGIAAVECGYDQAEAVAALMRDAGLGSVMIYKDLAGHGRVVFGQAPDVAFDVPPAGR